MAYRWLGVLMLSAVGALGCSGDTTGDPRGAGGDGGLGGAAGSAGVGGQGASGGSGGDGGSVAPQCETSVLCASCPDGGSCAVDDDCGTGHVCIESGCNDLDGASIRHCVFAGGGACTSSAMCPEGRECLTVDGEGDRCVRTAPGCDTRFDCVPGFACEEGVCVDRRVPCDLDEHCPKNHVCISKGASSFCARVQVDCIAPFDCDDLATACVDIDGDGRSECAGTFNPNDPLSEACENEACSEASAPVCEVSISGSAATCGQYGLCDGDECASGFVCLELWPDGRSECVPEGGSCASYRDCPVRQVCASPRSGEAPSCQTGFEP
jgi:hypothetical protein